MDDKKLKEILDKHSKWLCRKSGGERANLSGADLTGADLIGANLTEANLSEADLTMANLTGANFYFSDLTGANLTGANLYRADLYCANLHRADLTGVNLTGANLTEANMSGAKIELELLNKFFPICCPEAGRFTAWKKVSGGFIVKLEVSETAKRSSAYGRKCRCSEAKVLAIENTDGTTADTQEIRSEHDCSFVYKVGETIRVDNFDDDRRNECAPGIHFFITRQEAVDY